jgi:crotonobetainyl-CoA:carnitine CoA-transferase CaiB-like acyl-CoA transferase
VCDTVGGLNAAFAILAALYHRQRTGEGQMIDVALLDSIMPLMGWVAANLLIGGQDPVPMGNDNFTAAPSGTFRTCDGYVNIAANKQEQWEAMADVIGAPELVTDPRFQERDERKKNRKALTPLVEEKLRQKPTAHWVEALNARDVPSGDILCLKDALTQPQVQHRQVLQTVKVDGDIGDVPLFGLTARLSRTPGEVTSPPPRLGAHTEEVLVGVGYTKQDVAALKQRGTV